METNKFEAKQAGDDDWIVYRGNEWYARCGCESTAQFIANALNQYEPPKEATNAN